MTRLTRIAALAVLVLTGLWGGEAQAQVTRCSTPCTATQLNSEISDNLPSGNPNVLTAASVRATLNDLVGSTILPGVGTNVLNTQTVNYTVATTDCGKTIELGTGSTGFFTLTVPSVAGFPATCAVSVINRDTAAGKAIVGLSGAGGISKLYPRQTFAAMIVNGVWRVFYLPKRWPSGNVTLTVNKDTGVDTNDCMAAPCQTSAQVMTDISTLIDVNATLTIQYACTATPCTYTDTPFQSARYVGTGAIVIQGDTTTPANFVLTCVTVCGGGAAMNINIAANGSWTIQGFKLTGSLAGAVGIQINYCAACTVYFNRMEFGALATGVGLNCIGPAHVNDVAGGTYTISGSMNIFANTADNCIIHLDSAVGTLTGTPAFGISFLGSHGNSILGTDNTHFSGAATGIKCIAGLMGLIDTAATSASLPGNAACQASSGGYVN